MGRFKLQRLQKRLAPLVKALSRDIVNQVKIQATDAIPSNGRNDVRKIIQAPPSANDLAQTRLKCLNAQADSIDAMLGPAPDQGWSEAVWIRLYAPFEIWS